MTAALVRAQIKLEKTTDSQHTNHKRFVKDEKQQTGKYRDIK